MQEEAGLHQVAAVKAKEVLEVVDNSDIRLLHLRFQGGILTLICLFGFGNSYSCID